MRIKQFKKDNYIVTRIYEGTGYTEYYEESEKYYEEILKSKCSLCYICKRPLCQYLLDGEMYYGQEVGPGKNGLRTYECPKFIFNNKLRGDNAEAFDSEDYDGRIRPILFGTDSYDDSMLDFEEVYEDDIRLFKNTSDEYKEILNYSYVLSDI